MKAFLIIVISLFALTVNGQNINDSLLATFYNQVLVNSFDNGVNCGNRKTYEYLIKTDFDTARLIKRVGWVRLHFYKEESSLRGLLLRPWRRNKGRVIYRMSNTIYNTDSVDIDLTGVEIVSVTRRNISLSVSCGGTLGYIPSARFIFNKETKAWKYSSSEEIADKILRYYTHKQ
jgi:hypothetical protein